MSEIEGEKPYKDSGIKEGDRIVEVGGRAITCTADLTQCINSSKGDNVQIKYVRDGKEYETNINPKKSREDEYKLGLWVRDAAAGVGTITFYEPSSGRFAALGHGILDIDTDQLVTISKGEVVTANIVSVKKGAKGLPGEIKGSIENGQTIGEVGKNTSFGIYGSLTNTNALKIDKSNTMEIALKNEVKKGPAKIICAVENGKKEEYDIEIQKIFLNNEYDNKSMIIKITDERLLEKTGGIIQGMSGSPIVQDGKFVGAVTYVMVNDPTMRICCICRTDDKANEKSTMKNKLVTI